MVNQDNRYQQGQPPPTGMTGQNSSEPLPILAPANPPPGASAPTGMSTVEGNHNDPQQQQQQLQHLQAQHQQNQGVATHLMGFMANPALAAAAAASPIFPPTGMLTNPGSFFAMPELFQQQHQNQPQQQHTAIAQSSGVPQGSSPVPPGGGATTMTSSQPNLNQQQFATPHPYPQHQQHPFSQMEILRQQQHLQFQMQHHSQPQQHPHQRQAGLNGGGGFPGQVPSSANPAGIQIPPSSSASLQAQLAAAQAAAEAVSMGQGEFSVTTGAMNGGGGRDSHSGSGSQQKKDLTPEQRVKQNRERNREHARSTRLRKKAYVQKLKELVEGLHAERSEEVRQRRVAIQHLSETQNVRRAVIHSFLKFHSSNETDKQKWSTILEDAFWLKQPVTPYRCFRRSEIEQECRVSRGIDAVMADAASVAVMIQNVGSRSARWMQIKREEFLIKEEERTGVKRSMPHDILQSGSRFQHAISSLSSSSGSSGGANSSGGEEGMNKRNSALKNPQNGSSSTAKPVSNSSGTSSNDDQAKPSTSSTDPPAEELHDYHAKPLPDPKLADSSERSGGSTSDESPEDSNNSGEDTKKVSASATDSASSGSDENAVARAAKRRKHQHPSADDTGSVLTAGAVAAGYLPQNIARTGGIFHNVRPMTEAVLGLSGSSSTPAVASYPGSNALPNSAPRPQQVIVANAQMQPGVPASNALLQQDSSAHGFDPSQGDPVVITAEVDTSSTSSDSRRQTRAYYHVNEDDMILMDDIIMCPFVFRTQDAVISGALAECVMPGMLRGHFSSRNKLESLELIYDAMGFMQQLERSSGSDSFAQIIPGSLEMALSPSSEEARVITLAKPPFMIVNVNQLWTKDTKYTHMEVEGQPYLGLLQGRDIPAAGSNQDSSEQLSHHLDSVTEGRCACSTRLHYDRNGKEFVDFISSYPLTNNSDEITHILHVSKILKPVHTSIVDDFTPSGGSDQ